MYMGVFKQSSVFVNTLKDFGGWGKLGSKPPKTAQRFFEYTADQNGCLVIGTSNHSQDNWVADEED